jgi:hypothetical protein
LDWNAAGNTLPVVMMENTEYGESGVLSRIYFGWELLYKMQSIAVQSNDLLPSYFSSLIRNPWSAGQI